KHNPEACVRMLWQEFPTSRIAGMSEEEQLKNDVAILVKRMNFLVPPDDKSWGYYDPKSISSWSEFAVEGEIIEQMARDTDELYTNRFVDEFNQFDSAAVRSAAEAWHR